LFRLPTGIIVADLSGIEEGYDEKKRDDKLYTFRINISCENIAQYFLFFTSQMGEPGFFLIELPATESEEKKLRMKDTDSFYKHIYYLDGI
jgi:hypothetical protein